MRQLTSLDAQFLALESFRMIRTEAGDAAAGTGCVIYRALLEVRLGAAAAGAPIPFYGWDENLNTRWFELCLTPGGWRVTAIGTGP